MIIAALSWKRLVGAAHVSFCMSSMQLACHGPHAGRRMEEALPREMPRYVCLILAVVGPKGQIFKAAFHSATPLSGTTTDFTEQWQSFFWDSSCGGPLITERAS